VARAASARPIRLGLKVLARQDCSSGFFRLFSFCRKDRRNGDRSKNIVEGPGHASARAAREALAQGGGRTRLHPHRRSKNIDFNDLAGFLGAPPKGRATLEEIDETVTRAAGAAASGVGGARKAQQKRSAA